MRGISRSLTFAVLTLTLGACGTGSTEAAGTAPGLGESTSPSSLPSAPGGGTARQGIDPNDSRGPTFPLTLRRTGGIAGYDDTVVLQPNGDVLVDTRTVHGRVCLLPPARRLALFDVLSTLRHHGELAGTGTAGQSDVIRITLTDAHQHPFDLSDASLGSVAGLVNDLIADVTLTTPITVTCRTATT